MNPQLIYNRSRLSGWNGNKCVYKSDFETAIRYYNSAIELYALEYRYFVNRSYCYDQLSQFELALTDADRALDLNPNWGKCYFRKARALKGLNRLQEAEVYFQKVMELEGKDCKEAINELLSVRQLTACESGVDFKTDKELDNQLIDMNEDIETKSNENLKCDQKSNEKRENKGKKSKNSSNKSKNSLNDKQIICELEKTSIETTLDQIETNIDSEPKQLQLRWSCNGCIGETNVLKKLSDFLLNTQNWVQNKSENNSKSIDRISNKECLDKSDQKYRTNDNKFTKSVSNDSNIKSEPKCRPVFNRRNGRKNYVMNEMVDIWDDSKSRLSFQRSDNNSVKDFGRKSEPTNPWKFKGLWISNVIPTEQTKRQLREILSHFGKISSIELIPETRIAFINYDNPESPRAAMSRLQGVYFPNICINNEKLRIKFRPLYDNKNYPSINSANDRQLNNECYFWRTTGCKFSNYKYCSNKHIPANQGVDLQPWMERMQCMKPNAKYRRTHRQ